MNHRVAGGVDGLVDTDIYLGNIPFPEVVREGNAETSTVVGLAAGRALVAQAFCSRPTDGNSKAT